MQLKKLYPDMWETFIGMAGAVASFTPNDMATAEWLSRRDGRHDESDIELQQRNQHRRGRAKG